MSLAAVVVVLSGADHDLLEQVEIAKMTIIVANLVVISPYAATRVASPMVAREFREVLLELHELPSSVASLGLDWSLR